MLKDLETEVVALLQQLTSVRLTVQGLSAPVAGRLHHVLYCYSL